MATPTAQIDAIVTGVGLTIPMQTFTGGEVSRSVDKTRDPGATYPRSVPGTPEIGNVTVGVDYEETVHGPMLPVLRKAATDKTAFSVGHIRRDGSNNRIGLSTYAPSTLVRVTPPTGNVNATTGKSTLELEFSCDGVSG